MAQALHQARLQEIVRRGGQFGIGQRALAVARHEAPPHHRRRALRIDEAERVNAVERAVRIAPRRVHGAEVMRLCGVIGVARKERLEHGRVGLAGGRVGRQREELVDEGLWHGGEEHRRVQHRHVLQRAAGQAELQAHAARAALGVGRIRIAARQREAADHLDRLACEQQRAGIARGLGVADELADHAHPLRMIAALARMRAVGAFERIERALRIRFVVLVADGAGRGGGGRAVAGIGLGRGFGGAGRCGQPHHRGNGAGHGQARGGGKERTAAGIGVMAGHVHGPVVGATVR